MINVRELRVGNYLMNGGVMVPIDARSIFDIWDESKVYEPVPITQMALERLGFKKDDIWWGGDISYYHRGPIDIRFGDDEYGKQPDELDTVFYGQEEMNVKSVHQLQNLFYALTGEELVLK